MDDSRTTPPTEAEANGKKAKDHGCTPTGVGAQHSNVAGTRNSKQKVRVKHLFRTYFAKRITSLEHQTTQMIFRGSGLSTGEWTTESFARVVADAVQGP